MMQAEARRLQANDTTVVNPSGLDTDGQFASAYDLALWGREALARGDLRHYMGSIRHNSQALSEPADSPYLRRASLCPQREPPRPEGHSTLAATKRYTHVADTLARQAAERMGRALWD